jgi:hypothetical protein
MPRPYADATLKAGGQAVHSRDRKSSAPKRGNPPAPEPDRSTADDGVAGAPGTSVAHHAATPTNRRRRSATSEPVVLTAATARSRPSPASLFYLARLMGSSVEQIDRTYGHMLPESEDYLRGLLDGFDAGLGELDQLEESG